MVKSDSAAAINFAKNDCPTTHPCAPLIADIHILARLLQNIQWSHTLRETNSVADILTKKEHDILFGYHVFEATLPDIFNSLLLDVSGVSFVRGFS
ncbi:hypothetical protein AHAS_AhasUnG0036900 [Arachis hypogaea]